MRDGAMNEDRRVLFLQHQDDCGPGYLGDRAQELGLTVEIADLAHGALPEDMCRFEMIVALGSDDSVLDPSVEYLADEQAFLEAAVTAGVPVFGVCFGAQLLARVLGGRVHRLDRPEIGRIPVETTDPEVVEPGPWLLWHLDAFECPPDAQLLATTSVAAQAFRQGPNFGVQFHPEATPESVRSWAGKYRDELATAGVDPGALIDETERRRSESREKADVLLDRVIYGAFTRGRH